jgi:hypothetical protein
MRLVVVGCMHDGIPFDAPRCAFTTSRHCGTILDEPLQTAERLPLAAGDDRGAVVVPYAIDIRCDGICRRVGAI